MSEATTANGFKPKTVDGRAVEQKGTQRVVFELTK